MESAEKFSERLCYTSAENSVSLTFKRHMIPEAYTAWFALPQSRKAQNRRPTRSLTDRADVLYLR